MHLLEAKEGIVVLDVGRIGGSESVEVEHIWRARWRYDTEESGGKRGGKEDAWGLIYRAKLTQERRSEHERYEEWRSGHSRSDPVPSSVQAQSGTPGQPSRVKSRITLSIPIPPT